MKTANPKSGLLALAVAAAVLSACSSKQEKAANYFAQGIAQFQAGNMAAAREAAINANMARDDIAEQWLLLARVELTDRNLGQAYQAYSRVLELDVTNQEALQFVAQLGFQAGQTAEAEKAADRLLTLNPSSTQAMLMKGLIALQRKQLPEAVKFAEQIERTHPGDEGGVILGARALALSGDYSKAIETLKQAEAKNGASDGVTSTFLEIYRNQGDLPNLIAMSERLVKKQPNDVTGKLDLANTYYKSGNPTRARALLVSIIDAKSSDGEALKKVSELWATYDTNPLSPEQFARFESKGTVAVRMLIARERLQHGAASQAEAMLRPVSQDAGTPGLSEARALYARALDATGQAPQAQAIAKDILQNDKNNADALLLTAKGKLQKRDLPGAINDLQIVLRDHPDNEEAVAMLAQTLAARGEERRARDLFENAIKDLPQGFFVMQRYVEFLYGTGDKHRAMTASREFTQANPASMAGWRLYAQTCQRTQDARCADEAAHGLAIAARSYFIDERVGAVRKRGLFGRLK